MNPRLFTALFSSIVAASPAARADVPIDPEAAVRAKGPSDGYDFVFSAVGPGAGKGSIGLGGRVYLIVPTFDVNYARGFTDSVDFILNMSTLGIVTYADVGLRARFAGGPETGFSLGAKAAATPIFFFVSAGDTAAGVAFLATPGLVASFGSERVQFSLGFDFPMLLAGAIAADGETGSGTGFEPFFRPSATIEFPVGESTSLYIQLQGWVPFKAESFDDSGFFGPVTAVGAIW